LTWSGTGRIIGKNIALQRRRTAAQEGAFLELKNQGASMELKIVSRLIEAIDYQDDSSTLKVYMTNGQRREYYSVPKGVVIGLVAAASPGNYYMTEIRGRYPTA
jgi:hypothetical protein